MNNRSGSGRGVAALLCGLMAGCGGGGGNADGVGAAQPPGIALLTPSAGPVGTEVEIEGLNFDPQPAGNLVRFNGAAANVLSAASMQLRVTVPASASSGRVTVTTAGGTATSPADFTVTAPGPGAVLTPRLNGPAAGATENAIAWNGTRYVIVGDNLIEASTDARVWSTTRSFAPDTDLAWDGRGFVAIGGGEIATSPDGLTWTSRAIGGPGSAGLRALAGNGAMWVAVGEAGTILSSPDGVAWTPRSSGTGSTLEGLTWTGSQFIAVGPTRQVLTSPDGLAWTLRTITPALSLNRIAFGAATYVATADNGVLHASTDGLTWTQRADLPGTLNNVQYAGGRFVALGFYQSAVSTDGLTWTASGPLLGVFNALVHDGTRFVASAYDSSGGQIWFSADGLAWTARAQHQRAGSIAVSPAGRIVAVGSHPAARSSTDAVNWSFGYTANDINSGDFRPLLDVTWSPPTASFMAVAQVAANQIATRSADGLSWTPLAQLRCRGGTIAASDTLLVTVGFDGNSVPCIATSPDGSTLASWTLRTIPADHRYQRAFWTGSQFVAVGSIGTFANQGAIATSPDGIAWTARANPATGVLRGGAASPSAIVVVGAGGRILSSGDNGLSWTARSSGTSATLERVTWTGTHFFAVGGGSTYLRSPDGVTWTLLPTQFSVGLGDIAWVPGLARLLLIGERGLIAGSP